MISVCALSLAPWSVPAAWAACVQVYDADFVGQRCERTGDTKVYVSFDGTFTDASGGTFGSGRNVVISYPKVPDGTYSSNKLGTLRTRDFVGWMTRTETRSKDPAGTLQTTVIEERRGKHRMDDGGILEPDSTGPLGNSTSKLIDNVGRGYTYVMEGKVTSPEFSGTLLHEERQDTASPTCNTYLKIERKGEWRVPGADRFKGTLTTVTSCTSTTGGTPTTQVYDNRVKVTQ